MANPNPNPDVERIEQAGYVVLEDVLTAREVETISAELEPCFGREGWGRNDFEGTRTERVYSLLAKTPSVARLVEDPRVLAICDAFLMPSYLLAACQATRIHPGESAQMLHADDELGAGPRPRPPTSVSTMWALSDYTPENGSTLLVPGSHAWDHDGRPTEADAIALEMKPGSVLVWLGGLFHGGGPNTSRSTTRTGVSIIYFQPWLRQIENMTLAVPPETAARYSERIQRLLGYAVFEGLFYGHVNGRDPVKMVREAASSREE